MIGLMSSEPHITNNTSQITSNEIMKLKLRLQRVVTREQVFIFAGYCMSLCEEILF